MEDIVLVGFGGHARSVADCIERLGKYHIVGYTDLQKNYNDNGYEYLGKDSILQTIYNDGTRKAVITIGQIGIDQVRHKLYNLVKEIGFQLPIIIDPSAIISKNVKIAEGTFIGKGAVINSNTCIGKMCIINTRTVCEHDNMVGEFSHIAVGTVCSGEVCIGDNSFVGANSTIIQGVNIGKESVIGAGSIVLHNVNNGETRYGII